jgi:hypothetical protein
MSDQKKNPIFWCFIAVLAGFGLGIWGLIKTDCIGPNGQAVSSLLAASVGG